MPLYIYECVSCGWRQTDLEPMSAPTEKYDRHPRVNEPGYHNCDHLLKRIPSVPAPAQFNCSMPTYQKKKT